MFTMNDVLWWDEDIWGEASEQQSDSSMLQGGGDGGINKGESPDRSESVSATNCNLHHKTSIRIENKQIFLYI